MLTENVLKTAIITLDNKKASEISALKVEDLTMLTRFFVIATATSSTHVRALADEVEEKLSEIGVSPHHIEGKTTGWIVLDYGDIIVHIFTAAEREFYGLDRMWSDAEKIDTESIIAEN